MFRSANGAFPDVLHSDGPAPDRADKLGLYGFLAGSWATDILAHEDNGARHEYQGEIHAGWVLEGRALQDVWMIPPRSARKPGAPPKPLAVTGSWYGTTLRVYDPGIDAWHILWSDPMRQVYTRQIGREEAPDIVQVGDDGKGTRLRWRFTEITPKSFHWIGERAAGSENDWRKQIEMFARRVS
jgi:hypothetical protein